MTAEIIAFDPEGDLVLVLSYSAPETQNNDTEKLDKIDITRTEQVGVSTTDKDQQPTATPETDNTNELDATSKSASSDTRKTDAPSGPVHMVVSSRHMMLASPVFKAMLQHQNFKEGKELSQGQAKIPLPDDDPVPFKILLDIIHGRTRAVPRKVTLKTLSSISVLVDKYQMLEVIEMFSDAWIEDLKPQIPTELVAEEVMPWLGVTWVFRKPVEFKHLTRILEHEADDRMDEDIEEGIPIPEIIIDTLKLHRKDALFDAYTLIEQTLRRYQRTEVLCTRRDAGEAQRMRKACDAMLLGSLLKSAAVAKIFPLPEAPYAGQQFDATVTCIRALEYEALCDSISRAYDHTGNLPKPAHGLKDLIKENMKTLEGRLCGLDLDDFTGKPNPEKQKAQL